MSTHPIPEKTKQKIIKMRAEGVSQREISCKLGVSHGTVSNVLAEKGDAGKSVIPALRERAKMREVQEQEIQYREALRIIENLQKELDIYKKQESFLTTFRPRTIVPSKYSGGRAAVAFSVCSDQHIEEKITFAHTNGLNESNPQIIEGRMARFWGNTLKVLEMCRRNSPIDTLIVGLLGDIISGSIHADLTASNYLTPPQAVMAGFELLTNGLLWLRQHTDIKTILVVSAVGNHARTTPKIDLKQPVETSYEWIIYSFMAKWLMKQHPKGLEFQLPTGYFNFLTVLGRTLRFHHGNALRYAGGIGGIQIPYKTARIYWDTGIPADVDVFAHYHLTDFGSRHVCCNTIMGYSELFPWVKSEYSPPQGAFFLIHERFGKTAQFPIIVDEDRRVRK